MGDQRHRDLCHVNNANVAPPQASTEGLFQQTRLLSTVTSELPGIHRSADHNLLRSGGQVIGKRVMLTATQEPRPDPRLLQDRGSWPALSSRRVPTEPSIPRRSLL